MKRAAAAAIIIVALAVDAPAQEIAGLSAFAMPGPDGAETRHVLVWRPPGAEGPLPVLYVMDGMFGMRSVLAEARPRIESGTLQPLMVVATYAHPAHRTREYVPGDARGDALFEAHREWLVNVVLPWSEETQGAARAREQRAIGGFSNGADLAVAIGGARGDLFGAIVAHSPMNTRPAWVRTDAQRWTVSGGSREDAGAYARVLAGELERRRAPRRVCLGRWGHEPEAWAALWPGALAWAFGGAPEQAETALERDNCVNHAAE